MPMNTYGGIGSFSVASGVTNREFYSTNVAGAFNTESLPVEQLPHLFFWINQTAGAGTTVTPQYAIRDVNKAPNWHDLSAPVALAVGVPTILEYRFPATWIRLKFTGGAGAVADIVIGAASGV
jgi:hypothetical protein